MTLLSLLLALLAPPETPSREERIRKLIEAIADSGCVAEFAPSSVRLADPRRQIAPGRPPLLSFRYFVGADRHRFGKLDLMLDDAGH